MVIKHKPQAVLYSRGFVGLGEDNGDLANAQALDTFCVNTVLKVRSDYLQPQHQLSCGRTKQRAWEPQQEPDLQLTYICYRSCSKHSPFTTQATKLQSSTIARKSSKNE